MSDSVDALDLIVRDAEATEKWRRLDLLYAEVTRDPNASYADAVRARIAVYEAYCELGRIYLQIHDLAVHAGAKLPEKHPSNEAIAGLVRDLVKAHEASHE